MLGSSARAIFPEGRGEPGSRLRAGDVGAQGGGGGRALQYGRGLPAPGPGERPDRRAAQGTAHAAPPPGTRPDEEAASSHPAPSPGPTSGRVTPLPRGPSSSSGVPRVRVPYPASTGARWSPARATRCSAATWGPPRRWSSRCSRRKARVLSPRSLRSRSATSSSSEAWAPRSRSSASASSTWSRAATATTAPCPRRRGASWSSRRPLARRSSSTAR